MSEWLNLILWTVMGIGFCGAAIALYGRYRTLPSFLTGPNICKLESGGCAVLFRTPNAALFGVPNSALAVAYYPFIAAGLWFHFPLWILLLASSAAFGMSLYLAWILLWDKLECRVCWTGHVCNAVIWTILFINFVWN